MTVHGRNLQVVEMVRLQVGQHLGVDGEIHRNVGGQLAVAEDEDLKKRKGRRENSLCAVVDAKSISNLIKSYEMGTVCL